MFCIECGSLLGNEKNCPKCGREGYFNDAPLLCACGFGFHALSGEFCPVCNRANPFGGICELCENVVLADMDYCAKCGTKLSSDTLELPPMEMPHVTVTKPMPVEYENDPDMNRAVCVCTNILAILLFLAGGFMVYHGLTGNESIVYHQIAIGALCVVLAINWIIHRVRS